MTKEHVDELIEMLKRHEGLRLKPYRCTAGKLTIGYGRNLEDRGISKVEAELMLINDISDFAAKLKTVLPWMEQLDARRALVLVNMGFNLGIEGLLKFTNTLQLIKNGNYDAAAKAMLDSKWAKQVGSRARELAHIIKTGNPPHKEQ